MNRFLSGLRSRALKNIELSRGVGVAKSYGDCNRRVDLGWLWHWQLPVQKPVMTAVLHGGIALCLDRSRAEEPPKAALTKRARIGTQPRPTAVIGGPPRRSVTNPDH